MIRLAGDDVALLLGNAALVGTTGSQPATTTYEIVVKGEVSDALAEDLQARRHFPRPGVTVLIVDVIDQAHLRGVIERLGDLNIDIERVNPV